MIELQSYTVTDGFFGAPYLDIDEERKDRMPVGRHQVLER